MADGADASRPYLCHLISNTWHNFRLAELRAVAAVTGVSINIDPEEEAALQEESVFLGVRAPDDASVERLAARIVLVRRFVEVWASGDTWEELADALRSKPHEECAEYLAEGTTFKVRVESFGRSFSEDEKVEQIKRLAPLLPWRGKVRLKNPQHSFVLLHGRVQAGRARMYFGRVVASGQRELPGKYDLKKRNYIGTTSLDAELSLVMANLGGVRPGDLVYDPYCGTASTLVAAGHFGARVMGSDLYAPVLRGKLRTRCGPSAKTQPKQQGIGETFAQYGLAAPVALLQADNDMNAPPFRVPPTGLFDAILTDPPYGVREMSSKLDDAPLTQRTLRPEHVAEHTPRRAQAELEEHLAELFALAQAQLADGGRLVFLLPCTVLLPGALHLLPAHPALVIESLCEQRMAARWSRWCVTMRRRPRAEVPADAPVAPAVRAAPGARLFEPPQQRDYATAAPEAVLHPDLLAKSSCHRKKRARGKQRGSAPAGAAGAPAEVAESDEADEADEGSAAGWVARLTPSRLALACAGACVLALLVGQAVRRGR